MRSAYGFQFKCLPPNQDFARSATDSQKQYLRDLAFRLGSDPRTILANIGREVGLRPGREATLGGVSMALTFLEKAPVDAVREAAGL
jgi:hypothetical protein